MPIQEIVPKDLWRNITKPSSNKQRGGRFQQSAKIILTIHSAWVQHLIQQGIPKEPIPSSPLKESARGAPRWIKHEDMQLKRLTMPSSPRYPLMMGIEVWGPIHKSAVKNSNFFKHSRCSRHRLKDRKPMHGHRLKGYNCYKQGFNGAGSEPRRETLMEELLNGVV